jgi:hypothetical protein
MIIKKGHARRGMAFFMPIVGTPKLGIPTDAPRPKCIIDFFVNCIE